MRLTTRLLSSVALCLAYACGDDSATEVSRSLAVVDDAASPSAPAVVVADGGTGSSSLGELVCPRGGESGPVRVTFRCGEITVVTCKDLSNVVLELEDGTRQRFEGLKGHNNRFTAVGAQQGAAVIGVWVKAGNNKSGDGPGYGERVVAPVDTCVPPVEECTVVDGACSPGVPPPPKDAGCAAVDSYCGPATPQPRDAGVPEEPPMAI